MKEFFKTNTVTYNLMSFSGFKAMLIFSLLVEKPRSYKEIQDIIKNHEYLHETVSKDTIRIYLNSLKEFGCNIQTVKDGKITKFTIDNHPFTLKFDDKQIENLIKVYKSIIKSIEVEDLISLQKFFNKISYYIENQDIKEKLAQISPLSNINPNLVENLINYAQNNAEITILYNSTNSGHKNITLLVDKLGINNEKLYVSGFNSEYKTYSSFLVSNIIKVVCVNTENKTLNLPDITVGYEYTCEKDEIFEPLNCETIVKTDENKIIVEMTSKNKFEIMQRVMYHSTQCKVLYPQDFKDYIISNLKKMKEGYLEKY